VNEGVAKQTVRRILAEVFSAGRLDLIDELYHPGVAGKVRQLATALRSAFPDLSLDVVHLIEEDHKVACHWRASGTQQGAFRNVPPTGAHVSFSGTSIYVFEAGKVAEIASSWDVFGLLQQLREALLR